MAIEGSYNAGSYTVRNPQNLEFQQYMMYWDTNNPFAKGRPGVQGPLGGATDLPAISAPRAQARPVNMLGNARNLSFGGRNYGPQNIDRNEWGRLGSTIVPTLEGMAQQRQQRLQTTGQSVAQGPGIISRAVQKWRQRNVPPPPDYSGLTREERMANAQARAQKIAEARGEDFNQPGQPPTTVGESITNPTLEDTLRYQRERAQERTARASVGTGGAPPPPGNESLTSAQRMANAAARIRIQQASRVEPASAPPQAVPNRPMNAPAPGSLPAPGSMPTVASPVTAVGDQSARLASEGVASPVAGAPDTGGYEMGSKTLGKTLGKTRGKSLTKPISGGAAGPSRTPSGGTSADQPRRKY